MIASNASAAHSTGCGAVVNAVPAMGLLSPRQLRALEALLAGPRSRESLDRVAGCSNAPELIAQLRRRGLQLPCTKATAFDRDGQEVRIGIYSLTDDDAVKVRAWLAQAEAQEGAA